MNSRTRKHILSHICCRIERGTKSKVFQPTNIQEPSLPSIPTGLTVCGQRSNLHPDVLCSARVLLLHLELQVPEDNTDSDTLVLLISCSGQAYVDRIQSQFLTSSYKSILRIRSSPFPTPLPILRQNYLERLLNNRKRKL